MRLALFVLAIAVAQVAPDVDARARARVALALADPLDAGATAELVAALDDRDETVRLAAAMAACHSLALKPSVYFYALGTVHTAIRPALLAPPSKQDWSLTPDRATRVVLAYLPKDLPPARLARLKAAAVDANNLTRDASQFLLSRDALVSPALAREVDRLIFDPTVRSLYRLELCAMCLDRLGPAVAPVLESVNTADPEVNAGVRIVMSSLLAMPAGPATLAAVATHPASGAAELAALTLLEAVRDSPAARAALKEAFRAPSMQPKVRQLIAEQTAKLKR